MRLTDLKYVSEKKEKQFNKLGVHTQEELIRYFPRDYLDLTKTRDLGEAYHNEMALVLCEVLNVEVNRYARRPYVKALCRQGDYLFQVIWFNQPYVAAKLALGDYFFYGRVQNRYGMGASMVNPTFEKADKVKNLKGIVPVYPLTEGLTQGAVRQAVRQALSNVEVQSFVPYPLIKKYALSDLRTAYFKIHCPTSQEDIALAGERIAIEEYFLLVSAFRLIKGDKQIARSSRYSVTEGEAAEFLQRFPFEFTMGQRRAIKEILDDLHSPTVMNRLLQGDVGCGKTAVAAAVIYYVAKNGRQSTPQATQWSLGR